MLHKLHLRIWLAILVTLLAVLLGAWLVWHMSREALELKRGGVNTAPTPTREIVLRGENGALVAQLNIPAGQALPRNAAGQAEVSLQAAQAVAAGETLRLQLPQRRPAPDFSQLPLTERAAAQAQFEAARQAREAQRETERKTEREIRRSAQLLPAWLRPPYGFVALLALLALAAGLAVYPIARGLTRRLASLHHTVKSWGQGDLSARNAPELTRGKDEVAEVAREFNAAAAQVQKLLTAQKSLLANASHELRSPLARLRMALELAELPPAAQQEAKENIAELDALIEEILLSSRLDAAAGSKTVPFQPLGVDRLRYIWAQEAELFGAAFEAETLAANTQTAAHSRTVLAAAAATEEITADSGNEAAAWCLLGDEALLKRLLRNLLQNANRYGAAPVTVSVTAQLPTPFAASEAECKLVLRVIDSGLGIAPDERLRIFEPFYRGLNTRAQRSSEGQGGVGLGLALVRQIAEHHAGSVRCTQRPDGQTGACFEVLLPIASYSVA